MDVDVQILPSGEVMVDRSADLGVNKLLMSLLRGVVGDAGSLAEFLLAQEQCEQLIGDEPLCG
jgi:hypothetical protein